MSTRELDRRVFLRLGAAGYVGLGMAGLLAAAPPPSPQPSPPSGGEGRGEGGD
jgi:hypothetical protein